MTADLFDACAKFTCAEEGGYSCRRDDAGNWSGGVVGRGDLIGSNKGISAPTLINWNDHEGDAQAQVSAMKSLDETLFCAISRTHYWRGLNCDMLPPPIALMMFDFGFNAGVSRAGRLLQTILGMTPKDVDGDIGPKTQQWATIPHWAAIAGDLPKETILRLQAVCGIPADGVLGLRSLEALEHRPEIWPNAFATALAARQRQAYRSFRGFDVFGASWLARTARRLDAALKLRASS